jgi:hypothetical protein
MYVAKWVYDMRMPVLDVWMWPRGGVPGSRLTNGDVGFLRGWIVTSWLKALIGLIEYSYHQDMTFFQKPNYKELWG